MSHTPRAAYSRRQLLANSAFLSGLAPELLWQSKVRFLQALWLGERVRGERACTISPFIVHPRQALVSIGKVRLLGAQEDCINMMPLEFTQVIDPRFSAGDIFKIRECHLPRIVVPPYP